MVTQFRVALDIVLNKSGWAVLDGAGNYIASGMVNNSKLANLILPDRVHQITENILEAVDLYLIETEIIIIERAVVGRNAGGALNQSIVIGSLFNATLNYCREYGATPQMVLVNNQTWKRLFGVGGNAKKEDTLARVNVLYPTLNITDDNEADAIAMAYVADSYANNIYELMKEK